MGSTMNVFTLRLGKIFESKLYAMTTPSRNYKLDKDLADAVWIMTNHRLALTHAASDIELYARQNFVNVLRNKYPALVRTAEESLGVPPVVLHQWSHNQPH